MTTIADGNNYRLIIIIRGNRAILKFRAGSAKERCLLTVLIVGVNEFRFFGANLRSHLVSNKTF